MEYVQEGFSWDREVYEQGKYFLADLMMAADIFAAAAEIFKERGPATTELIPSPPVVIGSVKNDIHDIGKTSW